MQGIVGLIYNESGDGGTIFVYIGDALALDGEGYSFRYSEQKRLFRFVKLMGMANLVWILTGLACS